jgi:lipocalin-like protein
MKKVLLPLASFLFFSVLFFACKKSNNNNNTQKTKTQLITQASWKMSTVSAAGFGDITAQIPACYKDNVYTFASNGSGNVDESTNVCSPSTAGAFTWSFLNNETTLHISTTLFQGGSSDFSLITLNETNLVVSQMMTIAPLPATTVTVTFIH